MPRRCAATVTKIVFHKNEYGLLSQAAAYDGIVYDTKVFNCLNMITSAYLTFIQNRLLKFIFLPMIASNNSTKNEN